MRPLCPIATGMTDGPMLPKPRDPRLRRRQRRALIGGVAILLIGLLIAAQRPLLVGYARLFRVNDPAPSDALVVLLGGSDHRPFTATDLYERGTAPIVLLGQSRDEPRTGMSETSDLVRIMAGNGVPVRAITILPAVVTSTREEALAVRDYALARRLHRVTVVTTAFHTARARWVFKRALRGTGVEVRMAASPHPLFDESNWYLNDEGQVAYAVETLKSLYYRLAY